MTLVRKTVEDAAIGVGVASTAEALSAIQHPGCAAVIWNRTLPTEMGETLATINTGQLPSMRVILRPAIIRDSLRIACEDFEVEQRDTVDWLIEDVTALAERFVKLMSAPYLRVRLEVVTTNACRKFHIDAVTARLICTYRGTGTQYGISTDGADPKRVFTVPTGAPVILRGTEWPANPPAGLLHRSPPIDGTGETRLLLVLDPVFDSSEEI